MSTFESQHFPLHGVAVMRLAISLKAATTQLSCTIQENIKPQRSNLKNRTSNTGSPAFIVALNYTLLMISSLIVFQCAVSVAAMRLAISVKAATTQLSCTIQENIKPQTSNIKNRTSNTGSQS
ncbi:MAG: hypothetical protein ACLFPE_11985 [Bacteroidales bacterium]